MIPPDFDGLLADQVISLCIGRVLRLGSRPEQPGDEAEYDRVRNLALDAADHLGMVYRPDRRPCWVRDRSRGAQGD
jgi:hypothetical protein